MGHRFSRSGRVEFSAVPAAAFEWQRRMALISSEEEEQWGKLEQESFAGFSVEERVLLRRLLLQVYRSLAGDR